MSVLIRDRRIAENSPPPDLVLEASDDPALVAGAIGEVGRDNLYYMAQCGFDAFELRAGEDPQEALAAFGDFTTSYQSTTAQPLPLFRRRASR